MEQTIPLRLTQKPGEPATLLLGDQDIARFVAANGLSIDYDTGFPAEAGPQVTIRFAVGRLELDFDIELLERLLDDARSRADR